MGLEHKERIEYSDLIGKFGDLDAVIVPVLWGAQDEHGNALHVYLPDSATAWVFLNLDSNAVDFNFWMAHELGHCLTPSIGGEDEAERFADAFAQGFLYPEAAVVRIRPGLRRLESVGSRVNRIRDEAKDRLISPWTIRKAVRDYEVAQRLAPTDLGEDGGFAGATRNFAKGYKAMAEAVFKTQPPTPGDWVAASTKLFRTPFFGALASFCRRESGAEHFIHELLGLPLPDAKALAEELRG
jgi:Zn-dependent peptidase ImmA (M78 family)